MKVSYIVKLACLGMALSVLPLQSSYAGCGCGGNSYDGQGQTQDQRDVDAANPDND